MSNPSVRPLIVITTYCPYCDEPVSGPTKQYAGDLLHQHCYEQFGAEQESAFPTNRTPETCDRIRPVSDAEIIRDFMTLINLES